MAFFKRKRFRDTLFRLGLYAFLVWTAYDYLWESHLYTVTAYCGCPVCIDVPEFRDGKFASGEAVYWGGAAADPKIPFGTRIELVPHAPADMKAIATFLDGRRKFRIEDRGGKIKGRDIDLYIPQSRGGHKTALKWGKRRMHLKINGRLA